MKYLGVLLLVLSGNVMAEEVYYCSDIHANGFMKKDGQYKPVNFIEKKFKMKLQDDGNIAIENTNLKSGKELFLCSTPYEDVFPGKYDNRKSCVDEFDSGDLFNFNSDNGRYIWFKGGGYTFHGDTVTTEIGTCTKF